MAIVPTLNGNAARRHRVPFLLLAVVVMVTLSPAPPSAALAAPRRPGSSMDRLGSDQAGTRSAPNVAPATTAIVAQDTHAVYLPLVMNAGLSPSSTALIDAAVKRGDIHQETGLLYKVYVAFADTRLPAQYRGDDSQIPDSIILFEIMAQYDQLSPETQAKVSPFLMPPTYAGSWMNGQTNDDAQCRQLCCTRPGLRCSAPQLAVGRERT